MSSLHPPRVYIVDPDESSNRLLAAALKKYGINCESFRDSKSIIAKIRTNPPDLCIIDLQLGPLERGYDLIAVIRKLGNKHIPILISSSEKARLVISQALKMGANDYLLKPLNREILTSKLLQFINTTELTFSQPRWNGFMDAAISTTLRLTLELSQVEENGLILASQHLILKNSTVTLSGDIITEISGMNAPLIGTIISSELNLESEGYSLYFEFDSRDLPLLANIRSWLSKKSRGSQTLIQANKGEPKN